MTHLLYDAASGKDARAGHECRSAAGRMLSADPAAALTTKSLSALLAALAAGYVGACTIARTEPPASAALRSWASRSRSMSRPRS